MVPTLIYCAGKNTTFEAIALAAGWRIGVQLPNTVYHPPMFADQDWKQPNRAAYMAALARYRPEMATVLDLERHEQREDVLCWAEEAAQYVRRVLIIPKYSGAIDHVPRRIGGADVVLAYSVPTRYGGTHVPLWEFAGWPVHLLGGSPDMQMHYHAHLAAIADVVSADGNYHQMKATRFCEYWQDGRWIPDGKVTIWDAPAACFRRSCEHIMDAWQSRR